MGNESNKITEAQREDALRILRADYWQDVRGVEESLREELKAGNVDPDRDAIETWIHQTIDGHSRVIYTGLAIETLLFSDNDSAYEDAGIEDADYSARAFYAFRQDVAETIGDVDDLIAEFVGDCAACGSETSERSSDGCEFLCKGCELPKE